MYFHDPSSWTYKLYHDQAEITLIHPNKSQPSNHKILISIAKIIQLIHAKKKYPHQLDHSPIGIPGVPISFLVHPHRFLIIIIHRVPHSKGLQRSSNFGFFMITWRILIGFTIWVWSPLALTQTDHMPPLFCYWV